MKEVFLVFTVSEVKPNQNYRYTVFLPIIISYGCVTKS